MHSPPAGTSPAATERSPLGQGGSPDKRGKISEAAVCRHYKKDDLVRQIEVLELYCQQHGWNEIYTLKDVGSRLSYKKRGLFKLIDLLQRSGSRMLDYP